MTDRDHNPYAAPGMESYAPPPLTREQAIRKEHISHEASIKSLGLLYLLGALFLVPVGAIQLLVAIGSVANDDDTTVTALTGLAGAIYLGIGLLEGAVAWGLRSLRPWARWWAVAFSALGLLVLPIGTVISAYILYLLLTKKGATVFSADYQQVIAATPEIKYKSSIIVTLLFILLVLLFFVGVLAISFR